MTHEKRQAIFQVFSALHIMLMLSAKYPDAKVIFVMNHYIPRYSISYCRSILTYILRCLDSETRVYLVVEV